MASDHSRKDVACTLVYGKGSRLLLEHSRWNESAKEEMLRQERGKAGAEYLDWLLHIDTHDWSQNALKQRDYLFYEDIGVINMGFLGNDAPRKENHGRSLNADGLSRTALPNLYMYRVLEKALILIHRDNLSTFSM